MKLIAFVLAATATLVAAADCPVCIIGAGPAGLSAASRLESKGKQTVVFEKQATVGGKCQAYYEKCVTSFLISQASCIIRKSEIRDLRLQEFEVMMADD